MDDVRSLLGLGRELDVSEDFMDLVCKQVFDVDGLNSLEREAQVRQCRASKRSRGRYDVDYYKVVAKLQRGDL